MTRRDLQGEAKKQGRPWEIGKGFDESAPIGPIVPPEKAAPTPATRDRAEGQRRRSSRPAPPRS
jgi:fumarylpyruvate hydrolase